MTATAAAYHEVRWRELGTDAWSDITRAPVTAELAIDGLDREKTYEFQVRAVSACGARSVWVSGNYDTLTRTGPLLSEVDAAALAAQTAADNAQAAADSAASQAAAANATLGKISSDAWLTASEKPAVMREHQAIGQQIASVQASADTYGVSRAAHDAAKTALDAYLGSLAPAWNNTATDTPIVSATFNTKFAGYYKARQELLDAVTAKAKSLADGAQSAAQNAQAAAAAAQADATSALSSLADIVSDNLLTPGEKPTVIRDRAAITGEQDGIDAQASSYAITTEKTTYDSAVSALTSYLATLTSPKLWSDLTGNTTIVGTTFRQKFLDVYNARQALLNAIYAMAKAKADGAQATATTALNNAATAQAEADAASASAAAANTAIGVITSDGWLSKAEKPTVMREYQAIADQIASVQSVADTYGVSRAAHDAAKTALDTYLSGLAPAWNDTTKDTAVVRATFNAKFAGYYAARQSLLTTISVTAKTIADASASGPGDNMIANPTFVANTGNAPANINRVREETLCDGWKVRAELVGTTSERWKSGGGQGISLEIGQPVNLASGAFVTARAQGNVIPGIVPSAVYYIKFAATYAFNGSTPAFPVQARMVVDWLDKDLAHISYSILAYNRGGTTPLETAVTAPATAFAAVVWADVFAINTSGAAFTHDSSVLLRANFTAVWMVRKPELEIAGSGHQLGDARNQAMVTVGNYGAAWNGLSLTWTSTTTSVTFTASAATLQIGTDGVPYGQASVTVNGTAGSTVTYYLYYDDPTYAGGSRTLSATSTYINSINYNGRLFIAKVTVTYPTSGTGGGGGSTNPCVAVDARVIRRGADGAYEDARAGDIRVGDRLLLVDGRWGLVTCSEKAWAQRVRVRGRGALTCSVYAPLGLAGGGRVMAPDALGTVLDSMPGPDTITRVTGAGPGWVQHITCQDAFFWARDKSSLWRRIVDWLLRRPKRYYSHHNIKQIEP